MKKLLILAIILLGFTVPALSKSFGLFPTKIKVTVLEVSGDIVSGATVQLYKTKNDYMTNENLQFEGVTNKKGWVVIKNIEALPYFIEATKGTKKNYGKGVQVEGINKRKKNSVSITIE